MRALILTALLIPVLSFAQKAPDPGPVKTNPNFGCSASDPDTVKMGIGTICTSKNEIEIRLRAAYHPTLSQDMAVLSFKNGKWKAKMIRLRPGTFGLRLETVSFVEEVHFAKSNRVFFDSLFLVLKENNIFLLPDQLELGKNIQVSDGTDYTITYNVRGKYRTFRYNNPEIYLQQFPDEPAYRQLKVIISTMMRIFE
ncbi:MAG TPA: hypothetical protein VLJ68_04390 [Chitinophagaceae bacterium]|nr:hypothetical protein [Chitinophagaceae bacterium]